MFFLCWYIRSSKLWFNDIFFTFIYFQFPRRNGLIAKYRTGQAWRPGSDTSRTLSPSGIFYGRSLSMNVFVWSGPVLCTCLAISHSVHCSLSHLRFALYLSNIPSYMHTFVLSQFKASVVYKVWFLICDSAFMTQKFMFHHFVSVRHLYALRILSKGSRKKRSFFSDSVTSLKLAGNEFWQKIFSTTFFD